LDLIQTYIDAHAHLHDCYPVQEALSAALQNLSHQAARDNVGKARWGGCLMITELDTTPPEISCAKLDVVGEPFRRLNTSEPGCASFFHDNTDTHLDIIFGNQVVTAEGLEVLVYGHSSVIPAHLSLPETIDAAVQQHALIILPWGFGKWMGQRGEHLAALIGKLQPSDKASNACFLGDSAARLSWTQPPSLLADAAQKGLRNLPGSDPLPFASHYRKLGTQGFRLSMPMNHEQPLDSIKKALAHSNAQPSLFGQGETLGGFIYSQARMQIRKHTPFLR